MTSASITDSYFYKRNILSPALQDMFVSINPEWHITANFNRFTTPNAAKSKLRHWSSYVDRKLFGRTYYKIPADRRLFFFAIPEIGTASTYLHYHLLARLPLDRHEHFAAIAESTWTRIVPTGSLFVQRISDTEADQQRVIAYDLKDIGKQDNYDNFIISSEFAPH